MPVGPRDDGHSLVVPEALMGCPLKPGLATRNACLGDVPLDWCRDGTDADRERRIPPAPLKASGDASGLLEDMLPKTVALASEGMDGAKDDVRVGVDGCCGNCVLKDGELFSRLTGCTAPLGGGCRGDAIVEDDGVTGATAESACRDGAHGTPADKWVAGVAERCVLEPCRADSGAEGKDPDASGPELSGADGSFLTPDKFRLRFCRAL
jgi:hypothetical protein